MTCDTTFVDQYGVPVIALGHGAFGAGVFTVEESAGIHLVRLTEEQRESDIPDISEEDFRKNAIIRIISTSRESLDILIQHLENARSMLKGEGDSEKTSTTHN